MDRQRAGEQEITEAVPAERAGRLESMIEQLLQTSVGGQRT